MSDEYPVTVAVKRPDGSIEQVRVGTATKSGDGFSLRLGELSISDRPVPAARAAAPRAGAGGAPASSGGAPTNLPNYGRSKGLPIHGASSEDLEFYANGARRTLADPGKARFHDKERALLAAIEAEQARQGGGGSNANQGSFGEEPPPPGDEDAPF